MIYRCLTWVQNLTKVLTFSCLHLVQYHDIFMAIYWEFIIFNTINLALTRSLSILLWHICLSWWHGNYRQSMFYSSFYFTSKWYQSITWTNIHLSSVISSNNHAGSIRQEGLMIQDGKTIWQVSAISYSVKYVNTILFHHSFDKLKHRWLKLWFISWVTNGIIITDRIDTYMQRHQSQSSFNSQLNIHLYMCIYKPLNISTFP